MDLRLATFLGAALTWVGCHSAPFTPVEIHAPPSVARETPVVPGYRVDDSVLLPNQWSLRPVGTQILVGDFPESLAMHPGGDYVAVLHCGYGLHEIVIVDLRSKSIRSRVATEESFYGVAFSADGHSIYASGASKEVVHEYRFDQGFLSDHHAIPLGDPKERRIPAGLAIDRSRHTAYVADVLGHRISVVDLQTRTNRSEILLASEPLARAMREESAARTEDEDAITKRAEAMLQLVNQDAPYPYCVVLDESKQRLYVSLWAQSAVQSIDLRSGEVLSRWPTQEHPNEMLLTRSGKQLIVANANRNTITVLDTQSGACIETLVAELIPNAPPGGTPNSLALSPDEKWLFVANANINAVAVFDVSQWGKSRSVGFIPVGWYPTSVRVTPDGKKLIVANGKGQTSRSNRHGPVPIKDPPSTVKEYLAGLLQGTVSIIDLPAADKWETTLKGWTSKVYAGMPASNQGTLNPPEAGHPVARPAGAPSPIQHVLYIIKENRTYDQVLGDMPQGNGDPTLCLFGERITPNHHKLAREFVVLDNFYVESEVSADGHEWTVGAYATDFVEKMWPLSYGHNGQKKYSYPAEGNFNIAIPAGGYLWDRAKEAGVTYRSYGEFVSSPKNKNTPGTTRQANLKDHFDPFYHTFDMDYPDAQRADRFISELHRFEKEGEMPHLQIIRLPNDHTAGTSEGKRTPFACVADNDLALGRVVEAVSHSKFWPTTAIFVVEDDAQNGPDHVDAHRTIAFAISPYIRRGSVDSTLYSTASMLRTMEMILGLKPMSQFDAVAQPMLKCFSSTPDLTPYVAAPAQISLEEKNTKTAWGSRQSSKMNFAKEDAADDLLLNEVIWKSIKGPTSRMPAPVRAGFVFVKKGKAHDDDED